MMNHQVRVMPPVILKITSDLDNFVPVFILFSSVPYFWPTFINVCIFVFISLPCTYYIYMRSQKAIIILSRDPVSAPD